MPSNLARKPAMSTPVRIGLRGLLVAALLRPALAVAVNPDWLISQYMHTAWRVQEGVIGGDIDGITQTTDGYIWIGTNSGVVRFDGVRFLSWNPPGAELATDVETLAGTRDGSLWIVTTGPERFLWRVKDGKTTRYPIPIARYNAILEDRNGVIWLARSRARDGRGGLCRLENAALRCFGQADGFPSAYAETLTVDSSGDIWAGSSAILTHWKASAPQSYAPAALQKSEGLGDIYALAGASDGSIWVGTAHRGPGMGLQHLVHDVWSPFVVPGFDSSTLDVSALDLDSNGDLWIGTFMQGLYRIHGLRVDHFDSAAGLSSNGVQQILEDHEGNIWVTTTGGMDCFKNAKVMTYTMREGLSADFAASVVASRDGTVWIGNHEALDSLRDGRLSSISKKSGLPGLRVTSLLEDHDGGLWVGVDDGLYFYEHGRFRPIVRPNGKPTGIVQEMTQDVDGDVWVQVTTQPALLRIRHKVIIGEELISGHRIFSMLPRPEGGLWLGIDHGTLALYHLGHLEIVGHSDSIKSGIQELQVDSKGTLYGSSVDGLIGWRAGKTQMLTNKNGLPCRGIDSFLLDQKQGLWVYADCGLFSISSDELQRWWAHADAAVKYTLFDSFDGARPSFATFRPLASRSPDGKLWFVSDSVLQVIDPAHVQWNNLPPPVHIEEVIADRKVRSGEKGLQLPALTREIEIDYTALSYVAPGKVHFRYRLEGHDPEWHDAGTRRQAFYNDLHPGRYRFVVMASNNDGVWNQSGDSLEFTLAPAFYQTIWFHGILVLSAFGLIYLIHVMWVRHATGRLRARLEERQEERERIARELHDTLIQSVDGLMIYLQAAIDEEDRARSQEMLIEALDRADEVLAEGRERVRSLRTEAMLSHELSDEFAEYGRARAREKGIEFSIRVIGNTRALDPIVRDEIFPIGREALANAFQHSGATSIELELLYDQKKFQLSIRDNGSGIERDILDRGKAGHWGLRGMSERAARISAQLRIVSKPRKGTEVVVTIPSRVAYPHRFRFIPFFRHWTGTADHELS